MNPADLASPKPLDVTLETVCTPALVVDRAQVEANAARLRAHTDALGVTLRPHLKTLKSVPAARIVQPDLAGPITVSTLREAEVFAGAGYRDIIYGVGIAPHKLARVAALRRGGVDLKIILDGEAQAQAVAEHARETGESLAVLLEVDSDGKRAGLTPEDPRLAQLGHILVDAGVELKGVLSHAGASYGSRSRDELEAWAERERAATVAAAEALRATGLPTPIVSVGSTPTAHFARDLTGVTEVRAGVFVLHDVVMFASGVCTLQEIAGSVLTTVIGHQPERGRIFTDAGWTALSPDRGSGEHGYGIAASADGTPWPDVIVEAVSQEHGVLALRPGAAGPLPDLPLGTRVRILPNHACATCAMHDEALVVTGSEVREAWPVFRGW